MLRVISLLLMFLSFLYAGELKVLTLDGRVKVIKEEALRSLKSEVLYWERPKPMKLYDSILRGSSIGIYITQPTTISLPVSDGQIIDLFDINAGASVSGTCSVSQTTQEGARRLVCSSGTLSISTASNNGRLILAGQNRALSLLPNSYYLGTGAGLTGLGGRGVYAVVVDTGINLCHPAFAGKIFLFYDATTGLELDRNAIQNRINSGNCDYDFGGHGTEVAGVLVSMAPSVQLIVVKVVDSNGNIEDSTVIRALEYIKSKRQALGNPPMVINLSLGNNYGPGDGTGPLNLKIEEVSAPGFVIVSAAGNEGDKRVRAVVENQSYAEVKANLNADIPVELWYGSQASYKVELCDSSNNCAVSTPSSFSSNLSCVRSIDHRLYPVNNKYMVDIDHACNGTYTIRLSLISGSPVRIDLFGGFPPNEFLDYTVPDGRGGYLYTVANPADGKKVLSVGAFTSKALSIGSRAFNSLGDLAYFSSRGPTVDGRTKPDISAGGYVVYTAYEDGSYGHDAGTSFSSPAVAGLAALLLEANPNLDVSQIKDMLCSQALKDSAVGSIPNNFFGCGKAYLSYAPAGSGGGSFSGGSGGSSGGGGCSAGRADLLQAFLYLMSLFLLRSLLRACPRV
jgi:subtilisin family serine protease